MVTTVNSRKYVILVDGKVCGWPIRHCSRGGWCRTVRIGAEKRSLIRFREKGGKETEIPVHHKLEELLDRGTWRCRVLQIGQTHHPFRLR
jgi:hypothetical protein